VRYDLLKILLVDDNHYMRILLAEILRAIGVKDIALRHLAVHDMPTSGKPAELIEAAGIGARDIAAAVRALLA